MEMANLLNVLLGMVKVSVISGGDWSQFEKQVLANLSHDERLKDLSLLPTCGTKFYQYESGGKSFTLRISPTKRKRGLLARWSKQPGRQTLSPNKLGAEGLKSGEARSFSLD